MPSDLTAEACYAPILDGIRWTNVLLRYSGLKWSILTYLPGPFYLRRLLRLGGERRGEEAASQGAQDGPPVHYSIT